MHGGKEPLSETRILSELSALEVSVLRDQGTGKRYLVPAATGRQQITLYKAVGLILQQSAVPLKEESGEQLSWTAFLSSSKGVLLCSNGRPNPIKTTLYTYQTVEVRIPLLRA